MHVKKVLENIKHDSGSPLSRKNMAKRHAIDVIGRTMAVKTYYTLGPCRVPGYPGTRPMNRVPGSVLPVLLPESEILF